MARPNWFAGWFRARAQSQCCGARTGRPAAFRPALETLEDRLAPSVTPAHLYTFITDLTDAMGGPAIVANGGSVSGGRYVYAAGQGLVLNGALADTTTYSVAMDVSLDSLSRFFIKLIDFQSLSQDVGVYLEGGHVALYPGASGSGAVSANQDFQLVLTRDGASGVTSIYLNGVLQQSYTGSVSNVAIPGGNVLTFVEDDRASGGQEAVGGSVDYIATYNQVLTASQVANLGNPENTILPTVSTDQPTVMASETQAATNTGLWTNAVSLAASAGTITQNANGSWSWTGTGDDNSPYTVTVTATNLYGETATTSFSVSFTDVAPAMSANHASVSAPENTAATNTGTWSDFDDAVTLSANVGTVTENANGTWSWTDTAGETSPFIATITATNADGSTATASFDVSFTDVAPTVAADHASVTAPENTAAANTGTWSDFDDAVTLSASTGTVTQNANGTWSWSGTGDESSPYTVTITATNGDGATATTSFGVSFTDVAPTVAADNAAVSALENAPATNTGTWADYDDAVTLSASSGTVTQNVNSTWSWTGTGDSPYTVTITATNGDGATATTSFAVSFTDVAPTVGANLASVSVIAGATATNTGTFADYDDPVTLSASAGTVTQNANGTWSWSYATANAAAQTQTVTITATNSDGSSRSASFTLTVTRPQVTLTADHAVVTVNEGQTATNTGTWTDSSGVTLTASVGTVTANANGTWSWSFTANDGSSLSQTVTITATDSAGGHATASFSLVVNNVPPVITALYSSSPIVQDSLHNGYVAIIGAFTDPGTLDHHSVSVSWGDGSAIETLTLVDQVHDLFAGVHRYAHSGTFTITVTVTDDDGASAVATTTAAVAGVGKDSTSNGTLSAIVQYSNTKGATVNYAAIEAALASWPRHPSSHNEPGHSGHGHDGHHRHRHGKGTANRD